MGDTYASSWHPTFYAGGIKGLFEALAIGLNLADQNTLIVPGHGLPKNREKLLAYQRSIEAWLIRVGELQRQRISVESMAEDRILNETRQQFMDDNYPGDMPDHPVSAFCRPHPGIRIHSVISSKPRTTAALYGHLSKRGSTRLV